MGTVMDLCSSIAALEKERNEAIRTRDYERLDRIENKLDELERQLAQIKK